MLEITNPATQESIVQLQEATAETVKAAARQARQAQAAWEARPLEERMEILKRFGQLLEDRRETVAATLSREVGKPIGQARGEVNGTLGRLAFFLEQTPAALAEEVVLVEEGLREKITRGALGLVVNISAWNYPLFVGSNVFIPALLTGNAVLYKPSEFASLTGLALANLLWEAGVPREVFHVLVGDGEVGAALLEQKPDGVFFTGSYPTGHKIAQAMAGSFAQLQLELGGKDPAYVRPDVDVASVAAGLADGAFYNTGQSCCAVERIYVHQDIYEPFVEAFVETVKGFKVGDPSAEDTYIGPLTREAQLEVLELQVRDALEKGARLLCGGFRMDGAGNYFAPTVLRDVNHEMEVMREESFGPIIGIQSVKDDQEAVALMNDTSYGLTAAVYTLDQGSAEALLGQVRSGSAYWNCCDRVSPRLPWSGRGHSGVGLTLSTHGITTFTRPRAWHLRG